MFFFDFNIFFSQRTCTGSMNFFKSHQQKETLINNAERKTPYLVFNGNLLLLMGTCEYGYVKSAIANMNAYPVIDDKNRALMAIWIGDFKEANLEPHTELQISFFFTTDKQLIVPENDFSVLISLMNEKNIFMFCHKLWNNTERVVEYNSNFLSLNCQKADSEVNYHGRTMRFIFRDLAKNELVAGSLTPKKFQSRMSTFSWLRRIKWNNVMEFSKNPIVKTKVVPLIFSDKFLASQTYTYCKSPLVQKKNKKDSFEICDPDLQKMDFTLKSFEYLEGLNFAYYPAEEVHFERS